MGIVGNIVVFYDKIMECSNLVWLYNLYIFNLLEKNNNDFDVFFIVDYDKF